MRYHTCLGTCLEPVVRSVSGCAVVRSTYTYSHLPESLFDLSLLMLSLHIVALCSTFAVTNSLMDELKTLTSLEMCLVGICVALLRVLRNYSSICLLSRYITSYQNTKAPYLFRILYGLPPLPLLPPILSSLASLPPFPLLFPFIILQLSSPP